MREVKVCCAVIGSLLAIGGLSFANSFSDNSHYVSLGQRNGYYVLRPGSRLSHQLGLDDAPYLDTADPFRHGYGADVLAFRFNQRGVLSMPPAYIAQASANDFYTRRIGSLVRGLTTTKNVEALFGRGHSTAKRPDGFIYYYALPVYNPFENFGGGRR
jgi:hypothetical protein